MIGTRKSGMVVFVAIFVLGIGLKLLEMGWILWAQYFYQVTATLRSISFEFLSLLKDIC